MPDTSVSLRCAAVARVDGYRPAGTAASAAAFVLIETPLPWPADVGDHPKLAPLVPVVAPHGGRLQALVPDGATPAGGVRVIVYRRPGAGTGPFARFLRHERIVAQDRLAVEVGALLDEAATAAAGAGPLEAGGDEQDGPVDVLVCTHGRRDACCGGDGMRAYTALAALGLPGVRLWRTSHTGGHRFAPTALTFPDGRAWARADAELLAGIVTRSIDPAVAAVHDRGGAAFDDPFVQAADGAALGIEGWTWLARSRHAEVTPLDDDRGLVVLTGEREGGERLVYRAEVVVRRVVPVPDCGKPLDQARKTSRELEVVAFDPVVPGSATG